MSYIVTIKRERFLGRDQWVARDQQGNWRAFGAVVSGPDALGVEEAERLFQRKGQELAEYLYHRDEIGKVEIVNGGTVVEVLG